MVLIQISFSFEFLPANSVSFVPVQLRRSDPTARKSDAGDSFQLAPIALAVYAAETGAVTDAGAPCDGLDGRDLAEKLEPHTL